MTLTTFFETVNAHELDPRPRHNAALASAIEREAKDLPESAKDEILNSLLPQYLRDVTEALDRGASFAQLCDLLHEFLRTFRFASNNAMTRLRPRTPAEETARFNQPLSENGWCSFEISLISETLQSGESIQNVTPRVIRTNLRSITRDDLQARRPTNWTNVSSWNAQFSSESSIREIEGLISDRLQAERFPEYGRNLDFPNGIRPR